MKKHPTDIWATLHLGNITTSDRGFVRQEPLVVENIRITWTDKRHLTQQSLIKEAQLQVKMALTRIFKEAEAVGFRLEKS